VVPSHTWVSGGVFVSVKSCQLSESSRKDPSEERSRASSPCRSSGFSRACFKAE